MLSALAEHRVHVPYRDATLTKLLRSSLVGDARTIMLACVNPGAPPRARPRTRGVLFVRRRRPRAPPSHA